MMKVSEIKKELKAYDVFKLKVVVDDMFEGELNVFLSVDTTSLGEGIAIDLGEFEELNDAVKYAKRTASYLKREYPTVWEVAQ